MSQRSIEDFKAVLQGGGVRPTMFEVELTFPESVVSDSTEITRDGTFLVQAAALPASNVGTIEVPFRGRKLKVSGDRTFDPWNVQIMNDVSFGLRVAFEKWAEKIQNHNYALGATNLSDYFASAIVRQLDRDGTQLRSYSFEGIWPSAVGEIGLDFNATDDVERYDVTFNVQYWSAAKDGDPYTSAVPRDTSGQINDIIS
ncbi:tail tube protein [Synechococcus phage S-N03]|uniref:Tail tube protein n=1 Tax=Synechococcus phage S-N03 TaxID=2718943 RepID=A0A6G8R6S5_9CAUD|nr:tail tube [Synechococcus phage S-N03]QIN96858.1 tail tube protein [Synechococcus phage S-N03]